MKYYSSNLDFLNSLYASIKYFFEYSKNKKDRRKVIDKKFNEYYKKILKILKKYRIHKEVLKLFD